MKILKTMYHVTLPKTTSSEFVKVTEAAEIKKGTTTRRRWVGSNEKEKEKKEFGEKKEGKMMMMIMIK